MDDDLKRQFYTEMCQLENSPAEAISELEELRRMFIDRFGDPDVPMERVVARRTLKA